MSKVYWIKGRSAGIFQSLIAKMEALVRIEEMARLVEPEMSLALKINLSELGYAHYLPPIVVSSLFERLREMGSRPVVTDSCSVFKGSRHNGYDWASTALIQGFSAGETFDSQLLLAGGYTCEEGNFYPCDGRYLPGVELGSLLTDTGNVVVISHVTAHPVLGLAGAIYNLGLGFLTQTGKLRVHAALDIEHYPEKCDNCGACLPFCPTGAVSYGEPTVAFDPEICNSCLGCYIACPRGAMNVAADGIESFQGKAVDAADTAKRNIRGSAFFVNFLTSITPQTDDYPFSDIPFIPDLGIVASEDPIAVDWVTYQMITNSPGIPGSRAEQVNALGKGDNKLQAITGVTPDQWLAYGEEIGLGTKECEFLTGG